MAEHRLRPGRELIAWLSELGSAFGYYAVTEWPIPDPAGTTYVDVAWLASPQSRDALFLFEVESVAGSGIAENASKVLGVPTRDLVKPVFFFHLILEGGGGRPARAARTHAAANYAVYLLSEAEAEAQRFLSDVLVQHARLRDGVEPLRFWEALVDERAPAGVSVAIAAARARELFPEAAWLPALVFAAADDAAARREVAKLLWARAGGPYHQWSDTLAGYFGAPVLELALLAALVPERAAECLEMLQRWQEPAGFAITSIGPHFGRNREYDEWVIGYAPVVWSVAALLMRDVEGAPSWICAQIERVECKLSDPYRSVSGVWLLLVLGAFGLEAEFASALASINERGGLSERDVARPPAGFPGDDHVYTGDQDGPRRIVRAADIEAALAPVGKHVDVVGFALELLVVHADWEQVTMIVMTALAEHHDVRCRELPPTLFDIG